MSVYSIAERIASCLDEDRLEYAIGGALALSVWTQPRETADVDLSIFAAAEQLEAVFDSLDRAGVMIDRADARRAQERIGMFTCRAGKTNVDIFMSGHPHFEQLRLRRRQVASPESGSLLWFISADDLAILKLLFARAKDVVDLEVLFAAQPSRDVAYIRGWLAQMIEPGDRRFAILDDLERRFAVK